MKIEHLEYILEIANCKSITKAANSLHMAQPALSVILSNIETEMGFPIFQRYSYGVIPTEHGQKIINEIPVILDIYYNWKLSADTQTEVFGTIDIAAVWICCSYFLPKIQLQLRKKYPRLQVNSQELSSSQLLEQIRLGKNEFAIGILSSSASQELYIKTVLKNCTIPWEITPLYQDALVLIMGKENPYFHQNTIIEQEIFEKLTLVTFTSADRTYDILLNNKYFQFAQMVKVGSAEQIISLVANSDMVALMPASLISMHPYTQANCIKGFPIKALENERISHWLLHKPINRLTSVERIVLDEIKDSYAPNPA